MKVRLALATATLGALVLGSGALVGLAGCGQLAPGAASTVDASAGLSPEATALSTIGFTPDEVTLITDPSASPTPGSGSATGSRTGATHPRLRALAVRHRLAKNVEHGEVVVRTANGDKTVDVQRGTVTAINDTTVTVRCADGFSETWTFGDPIHVIEHRTSVQPDRVAVGASVGVAGAKSAGTLAATLLVVAAD